MHYPESTTDLTGLQKQRLTRQDTRKNEFSGFLSIQIHLHDCRLSADVVLPDWATPRHVRSADKMSA